MLDNKMGTIHENLYLKISYIRQKWLFKKFYVSSQNNPTYTFWEPNVSAVEKPKGLSVLILDDTLFYSPLPCQSVLYTKSRA